MTLTFNIELAQQLVESKDTFPVDLDLAWGWLGYSKKDKALDTLKSYFVEGEDFVFHRSGEWSQGGRSRNLYLLTVNCLKEFGMIARTSQGKEIRKYFLECEKIAKQKTISNTPQTYIEALKALVASEEAKEQLKLQNSILENQVNELEDDNERQAEIIDELYNYSSIIRIAKFNQVNEKTFNWRKLKSTSEVLGLDILQAPCQRYVTKNLYHRDAWKTAYPEYLLPQVTDIVKVD